MEKNLLFILNWMIFFERMEEEIIVIVTRFVPCMLLKSAVWHQTHLGEKTNNKKCITP